MKIKSSAFEHNEAIPSEYTCEGLDVNPPLEFHDIPGGTVTLALIVEDPDVPKNLRPDGMWDHWVVFNMPKNTLKIAQNTTPPGIQGRNTSNGIGYTGPCPPDRKHRYFFKLFALDTTLSLSKGCSKKDLEEAMKGHVIESAEMIGTYVKHHSGEN